MLKHFLSLKDLTTDDFYHLINRARKLKKQHLSGVLHQYLIGKTMAMIFDKASTRTRVSFEAGMNQMGGSTIFLSPADSQLGRGEPIKDSARVISSMVDIIMIRTFSQQDIEEFARFSSVPVINALTDEYHPCQLLADMQTFFENKGDIKGKTVAWIGDGNNMCYSYINAAKLLDFKLQIAIPKGYEPNKKLYQDNPNVIVSNEPQKAAYNADLIATDVWASMGQEQEQKKRLNDFKDFIVDDTIMSLAKSDAVFMHCLPAHRGEEVSADVIDGKQSLVFAEAQNRLFSQKALVEFLLK
ncbi:MAG: ornithine carbamoyltransferase [Gammaproteobacteria bacterium]|nr:MAG: ornithine carbamoyltransferase [Gammaproteobacteria bacterium]